MPASMLGFLVNFRKLGATWKNVSFGPNLKNSYSITIHATYLFDSLQCVHGLDISLQTFIMKITGSGRQNNAFLKTHDFSKTYFAQPNYYFFCNSESDNLLCLYHLC